MSLRGQVAGHVASALVTVLASFAGMGYAYSQAKPDGKNQTLAFTPEKGDTSAAGKGNKGQSAKPISNLDIQASQKDILAHLDAIIAFYRSSVLPIQKAGEPNDVVYFDQSVELASQAASFAFQSARAEAALLARHEDAGSGVGEQQRLQTTRASVEQHLTELKAQADALDKQIDTAKPSQLPALREQQKGIQAAIGLSTSMDESLSKIVGMSDGQGTTGLAADVERMERSVPELNSKTKVAAPQLITLESARSAGVSSQGEVLFQLLETKHDLATLMAQNDNAYKKAQAVRVPLSTLLRSLVTRGQQMSDEVMAAAATPPPTPEKKTKGAARGARTTVAGPASTSGTGSAAAAPGIPGAPAGATVPPTQTLASITADFKALSSATVPLSQEIIVLQQSKANLTAWQTSVEEEYKEILHTLLLRIIVIAIALLILFGVGEVWRRTTNKYIQDTRRRRQLLVVRRVTISLLSIVVVLFGFVTQFNSLATFAGFITAGIAVGLQTILLSVAAYFFIIGRFGVKVGDRITVSGVTGDVIEVGLVRFYMMELAGSGVELNPTGRVAVFSNAVLFQAGTPLYKQIPGTDFAWRELIVKLNPASNYEKIAAAVEKEIAAVYETYRGTIEQQHRQTEDWMQAPMPRPVIDSQLQFNGGVFQLWSRFPVEIRRAAQIDEQLTKAVLKLMEQDDEFKQAFAATPTIQASVKG